MVSSRLVSKSPAVFTHPDFRQKSSLQTRVYDYKATSNAHTLMTLADRLTWIRPNAIPWTGAIILFRPFSLQLAGVQISPRLADQLGSAVRDAGGPEIGLLSPGLDLHASARPGEDSEYHFEHHQKPRR